MNAIARQLDVIDAERNLLLAELNRIEAERGHASFEVILAGDGAMRCTSL